MGGYWEQGRHLAGGDACVPGQRRDHNSLISRRGRLRTRTMVAQPAELGFELFYYHEVVVFFALLEEEVLVVEQGSCGDGCLRVGEFLFVE